MNVSSSINNIVESISNFTPTEVVLHLLLLEVKVPHAFTSGGDLVSGVLDLVVDVVLLSEVIEGVDSAEDLGAVFVVRILINGLPDTRGLISQWLNGLMDILDGVGSAGNSISDVTPSPVVLQFL